MPDPAPANWPFPTWKGQPLPSKLESVTMKIKTSELTGAALDWAVAKCEGTHRIKLMPEEFVDQQREGKLCFSSNWAQGGPIIEREQINLYKNTHPNWKANYPGKERYTYFLNGSPLIAAMRCYVASKLGDEVEIPEALKTAQEAM